MTSIFILLTEKTNKKHSLRVVELNFLWGNMMTATWETAPQVTLRNCSKDVGGKERIYVILVKGEYVQSSTNILEKVFASLVKLLLVLRNCHYYEGF